jgi:VWFA-related protein
MAKGSPVRELLAGLLLVVLCGAGFLNAQTGAPAEPAAQSAASSTATAPVSRVANHHISLDVLVTDKAGKPVSDLEPFDFSILDNNQPRKVLGFRRTDGRIGNKIDPPTELIIVIDAVNMAYQGVTLMRLEVEKFLRRNGGHLAQPTSVFIFTSDGMRIQPQPSQDGNALASMLDQSTGTVRAMSTAAGVYGQGEQFSFSTRTLKTLAENEALKPGRKMVVWIGSGWPLLQGRQFLQTNEGHERHFASIVEMSRKLREARITLYGIFTLYAAGTNTFYQGFLKGVKASKQADAGNLAMQVLATQTGGRVLGPSNDIDGLLASCVQDVGEYYTLVFEPPPAVEANEYHDLKVQVNRAAMDVHTTSGYYNRP